MLREHDRETEPEREPRLVIPKLQARDISIVQMPPEEGVRSGSSAPGRAGESGSVAEGSRSVFGSHPELELFLSRAFHQAKGNAVLFPSSIR